MNSFLVACFVLFSGVLAAPTTKNLQSDFQEFADLIPVEKLKAIVQKYQHDEEYQYVVHYLKSYEWTALREEISSKPGAQVIKMYLLEHGIDIGAIFQDLMDTLTGMKPQRRVRRGLNDFVQEIKEAVSIEDIEALLGEKLHSSKDFQEFFGLLSSEPSRKFVEEIRVMPEVKRVVEQLLNMDVDVRSLQDYIYNLFGWNK